MRITALDPQPGRAGRVDLHLDGELRGTLAAEVVFAEHLHPGDEIGEERLAELLRRDLAWRAREAALVLLSYRPRTAAELRRRLAAKGFPGEVAEACVAGLAATGVVDDASFAEAFVRDRVRVRPQGRRRLARELRVRGVERESAATAIDGVMQGEETDDLALARRAAARWRPRAGEDAAKARRRLYAFLARRGFGGETLRTVLAERLGGGLPE